MASKPELKFPKSFLWGVSTSAHQVEGGNHNQWSVWELENAKSLAAKGVYQYDDLDNWHAIKTDVKTPDNYVSGKATNHYDLFEHDFELARKMNMNAWRFSIEWSRVQPEEGAWNSEAIQHYKTYLAELKKRNIEPVVTLFHFTLPVWFAQKGGFEKRSNVRHFVEFADRLLAELGQNVRYIITINEPEVYIEESYLRGHWPPQVSDRKRSLLVMRNLIVAHNRTADMIHAKNRRYKVSIAKNYPYIYAGDDSWLSQRTARIEQYRRNDYFLARVVKRCDFIGINYYSSDRIYGYRVHNPDEEFSDVGWDMQPSDIQHVIERVCATYKLPVMITENGLADSDDSHRQWWLTQTILGMQKAMNNGSEVLGYLHWSLTDNFEWDKGFWPRYGLFAVDYTTYARTPRPSALWYARVIKKVRT